MDDTAAGPTSSNNIKSPIQPRNRHSLNEKKIIIRVFNCLARDHPREKDELVDMCSDYTGVSKSTIYKTLREEKIYGEVQAPKFSTGRKKIEVDEDAKNAIRRTVNDFLSKNEPPTLEKLLEATSNEEIIPKMSKGTFRKHLQSMNLNFGEVDCKRQRFNADHKSESFTSTIACRLCLNLIHLEDSEDLAGDAKSILQILNLKLNFDIVNDPKICRSCHKAMLVCYEFKNKCREKALHNKVKIDKETDPSNVTSEEKFKLCHFCLGSIDEEPLFVFDKHKSNFIEALNREKPAVACRKCFDASHNHFMFINTCLDTEQKIETYCISHGRNSQAKINLDEALQFVLQGHVKSEHPEDFESVMIKEELKTEPEIPLFLTEEIEIKSEQS